MCGLGFGLPIIKKCILPLSGAALAFTSIPANASTIHTQKTILEINAPDHRPCTFVRLQGVTVADPVTPGSPWLALPKTHLGYYESFSMLVTAFTDQIPVTVFTTGNIECGHAEIWRIKYE